MIYYKYNKGGEKMAKKLRKLQKIYIPMDKWGRKSLEKKLISEDGYRWAKNAWDAFSCDIVEWNKEGYSVSDWEPPYTGKERVLFAIYDDKTIVLETPYSIGDELLGEYSFLLRGNELGDIVEIVYWETDLEDIVFTFQQLQELNWQDHWRIQRVEGLKEHRKWYTFHELLKKGAEQKHIDRIWEFFNGKFIIKTEKGFEPPKSEEVF